SSSSSSLSSTGWLVFEDEDEHEEDSVHGPTASEKTKGGSPRTTRQGHWYHAGSELGAAVDPHPDGDVLGCVDGEGGRGIHHQLQQPGSRRRLPGPFDHSR